MALNSGRAAAKRKEEMPVGTPFEPGQSGNPAGRAKGSVSIKAELQKIINIVLKGEYNPFTDAIEEMPGGRKIALNLAIKAAEGDMLGMIKTMEHLDGKPPQSLNVGGQEEKPSSSIAS